MVMLNRLISTDSQVSWPAIADNTAMLYLYLLPAMRILYCTLVTTRVPLFMDIAETKLIQLELNGIDS